MAKTMVGVADGDEPLDPEIAARLRDFAALAAKSGLPELARLQASLDESIAALRPTLDTAALMPKFDTAALTAALRPKFDTAALTAALRPTIDTAALMPKFDTAALMPKFDTAALMPKFDTSALTAALRPKFDTSALMPKFDTVALMPKLHFAIAAAAQIDLRELVGFERVAEGLATSVSADALSGLAASVEQAVPDQPLEDFASLLDPDIIQWATTLNFDDEPMGNGGEDGDDGGIETDEERRERLREHLMRVARWLYTSAALLRAGVLRLNTAVESLNENTARYETLAVNLIKLYGAIMVIHHFL
jgi:hypothetical protein